MKFITLEILNAKSSEEKQEYLNVLDELNIVSEDETFWKETSFNIDAFQQNLYCIEARELDAKHSTLSFVTGESCIVNLEKKDLIKLLEDI